MPNFQNGKIYAIRSHQTAQVYVGSTTQPLSVRFGKHKLASNLTSSKEIVRLGDAYIELIENYPCDTKDELNRREGQIIRSMNCVNKRIEGRSQAEYLKQYREDYREERNQKSKQYHQAHREERNQRSKQYCKQYYQESKTMRTCVCGVAYNIGMKHTRDRHYKTQQHARFVSGLYERLRGN